MTQFDTVAQYSNFYELNTLHPLINVIDFSQVPAQVCDSMHFGIYGIFLKDVKCGELRYGRHHYDYQEGSLIFIGPGQVLNIENAPASVQPQGHALLFHPDAIKGTPLARHFNDYHFFSYATNEALHLSQQERQIILDCFAKIALELQHPIDKHTKNLVAANLDLLLNYCTRFYDRQFITRDQSNKGILEKFESLLNDYFQSDAEGLPTVAYCAQSLHLSPKYFGDLIKKETGKSAQEYIQLKLIDTAKEKIFDINKSISQIAYELGFRYPQHFTRLFKQHTGHSPQAYRSLN